MLKEVNSLISIEQRLNNASSQYQDNGNKSSNCLFLILPLLAITALVGTNYVYTNQGMGWPLIFEESIYT
jgi:hypothetical protein